MEVPVDVFEELEQELNVEADRWRAAVVDELESEGRTKSNADGEATQPASADVRDGEPVRIGVQLRRAVQAVLTRCGERVEAVLTRGTLVKALNHEDMSDIERAVRDMEAELVKEITPIVAQVIKAGGLNGYDRITALATPVPTFAHGPESAVFSSAAARAAEKFTGKLAGSVRETTIEKMRAAIGAGIEAGESIPDISRRIQETGAFAPARAEMIARSESARAYVRGMEEGWKASGIVSGKTWLLAPGACEFCEAAAEEFNDNAVALGEAFYKAGESLTGTKGGTMTMDYGDVDGPALHPSCRCSLSAQLINPDEE